MPRNYPTEKIMDAIGVALDGISTESGDSFTPIRISRWSRGFGGHEVENSIVYWVEAPDDNRSGSIFESSFGVTIEYVLGDFVLSQGAKQEPDDVRANKAREDILRAAGRMDWQALSANLARVNSTNFRESDEDETDTGARVFLDLEVMRPVDDTDQPI